MLAVRTMQRVHHAVIDSTNSEALRLIQAAAAKAGRVDHPLLITADEQTAGRGRNSRTWQSPRGGAWMSVIWPLRKPAEHYTATPLVAGLATLRAIRRIIEKYQPFHVPDSRIKWPNDVLLNDRKVAGILCEAAVTHGRVSHIVIGVGINIDFPLKHLKGDLRHLPTTLRQSLKLKLPVETVINAFRTQFATLMSRFDEQGLTASMYREINANLAYVGQTKTWAFGDESREAEIAGIDRTGRLLLRSPLTGEELAMDYGEICAPEAAFSNC